MYDVNAVIKRLKEGLDGLGKNPTEEELNNLITGIFGCRLCDLSCFMTDDDVFQTMLDAIPVPIYFKNTEGQYLACNNSLCIMFETDRKDIIGRTAYDFFPHETADIFRKSDLQLIQEESEERLEHRGLTTDVTDGFHVIHKRAFKRKGKVEGILGVIMDMSELKRVEDTAWESEAFFKALFIMSPTPIVIVNSFNIVTDMNKAAVDFFPEDELAAGQEVSALFSRYSDLEKVMSANNSVVRVNVNTKSGEQEMIVMVIVNIMHGEPHRAIKFIRTDIA
ncbi:PAS domain-containing protein [Seleniivibrio woodruffii]|uniref:PAS domain S-box-containing protein n=1 Tax=Seleniivibrio woodruffii TaxID=1078050 RepID=A0A4V6NEH7_9BACT|nr:PAS domain-containing protein [Seleniivibrio woodruffii]TCK62491.1 PAS domain S-box-containing protein [Seleniivibrio woodruffii]TVZ37082.1 PAS domain S-box-containing protein [Seleniivibrio woodruffii]